MGFLTRYDGELREPLVWRQGRYTDDTTLKGEIEKVLKSLLMEVEESEKIGLKLNIQKTKIMASGPITSWQIDGETVETVTDFILGGSKITANGDCSHEIKRRLLLGRKVIELRRQCGVSHEVRWGAQGASHVVPASSATSPFLVRRRRTSVR